MKVHGIEASDSSRSGLLEDVQTMLKRLSEDTAYGPTLMYLPDEAVRRLGGDPNDYPELEGYPGLRVIESR